MTAADTVVNLTAVIRCRPGQAEAVLQALTAVGHSARANEPGTLGYVVVRSGSDPDLLLTQERFRDRAAMEAHNAGGGSKAFFAATDGLLADVTIHVGAEAFDLAG